MQKINDFSQLAAVKPEFAVANILSGYLRISNDGITINGVPTEQYKGQQIDKIKTLVPRFIAVSKKLVYHAKEHSKGFKPISNIWINGIYAKTVSNFTLLEHSPEENNIEKDIIEKDIVSTHESADKHYCYCIAATIDGVDVQTLDGMHSSALYADLVAHYVANSALNNVEISAYYKAYDLVREYYKRIGEHRNAVLAYGITQ